MPTCEICGNEPARYVCSNCGRSVGPVCFQREGWLCKACFERVAVGVQLKSEESHSTLAQTLFIIAFLMVFAGVILLVISGSSASPGGFIIVFPFFFASNGSGLILVPALVIVTLMIILTILELRKNTRK